MGRPVGDAIVSTSVSSSNFELNLFVPVMFHPATHFFVGFGPLARRARVVAVRLWQFDRSRAAKDTLPSRAMLPRLGFYWTLTFTACVPRMGEPNATTTNTGNLSAKPMPSVMQASPPLPSAIPSMSLAAPVTPVAPPHHAPPRVQSLPQLDNSLREHLGEDGTRRFEFLRSLCPIALQHNANRWLVGCRACPPFDDAAPDGTAPEVGFGAGEFYELESLTPGSFTRAGADEMAAVFSGCEAADENRGGTLLAERGVDGLWASRSYKSGLHPDSCLAFRRPDGRDLLVCRWEYTHQGRGSSNILVQDFAATTAKAGEDSWANLLTLEDVAASSCMDLDSTPTSAVNRWVTTGRIDALTLLRSGGGSSGLVVHAHASRGRPTAAYLTLCRKWLNERVKANPRYVDVRPGLNAPALRLVFLWRNNGFEPDAATKASLLQLGAMQAQ